MDEQDNTQQIDSVDDADLRQQLLDARAEAERNLNGWKRSEADFQNYQKRKESENKELVDFAREVSVAKLLPTLDSLEQALRHAPQPSLSAAAADISPKGGEGAPLPPVGEVPDVASGDEGFGEKYQTWLTGINGLVKQLDKALEELGVKKIEAVGKKFDPNFHEAVREVPGEEDGMVVEEYQTGFELNGKLIRPSQVAISKKV